jgi:hypothetical protein
MCCLTYVLLLLPDFVQVIEAARQAARKLGRQGHTVITRVYHRCGTTAVP